MLSSKDSVEIFYLAIRSCLGICPPFPKTYIIWSCCVSSIVVGDGDILHSPLELHVHMYVYTCMQVVTLLVNDICLVSVKKHWECSRKIWVKRIYRHGLQVMTVTITAAATIIGAMVSYLVLTPPRQQEQLNLPTAH